MTWRDHARPVIAGAIAEGKAEGLSGKELRAFVNKRYPFGPRAYHPYKIWLSELRRQLGDKPAPPRAKQAKALPGQGNFWETTR